jgi:hypothetical protein
MFLSRATARAGWLGLALLGAAAAASGDATYQSLRQAPVADAFVVENIVLHRDAGVIRLKSGTIGFTAPLDGRDTAAVFTGEGEFTLTPGTAMEKSYLKSLTEQESVTEAFDRAVLYFTDDTGKEIRGQAKTKASEIKLAEILKDYRKRLRNESHTNIEAGILADLYRAGQPGFFSIYLHGRKHSELQFHLKPRGVEATLGPEEVMLLNVQPIGAPDEILYHAHRESEIKDGTATSDEDHRAVVAESYTLDTSLARNDHLSGTAKVRFKALATGERVIPMDLVPTLRVAKVTVDGQEASFIQEDKKDDAALAIVLPKPLEKGSTHEVELEYAGDKVVRKEGGGNFAVGARESWYPNLNTFHDHAKFDLTFHVPKQYTLVSIGKLEKQWPDKDLVSSHWTSEAAAVAGFNYGTFKKKSVSDAQLGVTFEGYATSEAPDYLRMTQIAGGTAMSPSALIDTTLVDAQNALRVYSLWFGKPNFDRIAITQQPEFNFGQSWPSLVYLPMSAYLDSTQRWQLLQGISTSLTNFVEEVTPHEVSHQYWGHMVGWSTYHDQWLSEGFATFSASLFLQFTKKDLGPFQHYWDEAHKEILDKNKYGKRANDAGPIWMGMRLLTEKNGGAYRGVVYEKGAYILHMLRQMMRDQKEGDKAFMAMMHDFVETHRNGNASTESFQRIVEKHMTPAMNVRGDGKMDWFFKEWVYGTAIPKYKIEYTTAEENGKTMLKGTVTQSEVPDDFVMLVPIYIDFDGQVARMGSAKITGNTTLPLNVAVPKKPRKVMLNYMHDVLEQ